MKKMSISANHEALLIQAKILLHKICTKPLLSTNEYRHLHTSDNNIEKFSYDTLFQWVRSTRNSIERYFLLQNNFWKSPRKIWHTPTTTIQTNFHWGGKNPPILQFHLWSRNSISPKYNFGKQIWRKRKNYLFHQIHIYIYIEYTVIMLWDKNSRYILETRGQRFHILYFLYFTYLHIYYAYYLTTRNMFHKKIIRNFIEYKSCEFCFCFMGHLE